MNFIFKQLVDSPDFPCKSSETLTNQYHSETALWWLRELHSIITVPVVEWSQHIGDISSPKLYSCGVYRSQPAMSFMGSAPLPEQIPLLLHNWLLDISTFHEGVKPKIATPHGLTQTECEQIYTQSLNAASFMSCVQPFENSNNLIGRLVENIFRVCWRLPWKQPDKQDVIQRRLAEYHMKEIPVLVQKIKGM